jgi:hypothetical protein
MTLTGLPLVLGTGAAALSAIAFLGWSWNRGSRKRRLPTRVLSLLLSQTLLVLAVGLLYNRQQQFYPSWQALAGQTGAPAVVTPARTGRLDASFAREPSALWQPPGSAAWQLAAPPRVTVPAGYATRPLAYPVLLALGGRPAGADLIEVTLSPGGRTGSLAALPGLLATDLRATPRGWVLVAAATQAPLARRLVTELPGRFAALATVGPPPARADAAVPTRTFATWSAATSWAVAQSPPALASPRVLPTALPA